MYRIIGADGKEYGPVSAEQMRQWIVEGRVNGETRVITEGFTQWMPIRSLPEFSLLLNPAPFPAANAGCVPVRKTNSLAMAGMILGILALTVGLCCYGLPFNILGLVFSIIGLVQIRSEPERHEGKGLAITGIILCVLSILLTFGMVLLFGVMAAFSQPPELPH
jgi:hypothetical protein